MTTRRGRRPTLSLDAVLDAAIALLDESGQDALTFRALAARLDTGVGSIYHYVASKDELLDRATDAIVRTVVDAVTLPTDPYDALRVLALDVYDAMQARPWVGLYLMRNVALQPSSMRLFDLFGRQVLNLPLTSRQRLDAVSSLVSYAIGTGAEMRSLPADMLVEGKEQAAFLREFAEQWRALDPAEYPFVHEVADEFEHHDDREQFRAGVDLFLTGLAVQAAR